MINELIVLMERVKTKISDDSDMTWVFSNSPKELRDEIDQCIIQIRNGDINGLDTLNMLFAATSAFQEHSLSNGWADEYITIAEKFDKLYHDLVKQ
jgi:hypothetical protein